MVTTMTTMTATLLALSVCVLLVLMVRWVAVTRRDITTARDLALQAHLDWRPKGLRTSRSAVALRN